MNPVIDVFASFYKKTLLYLPNFFYGLLVLILGLLLSSIVKQLFISLVSFIKLSKLLKNAKIANEKTISVWIEVLAELLRWVTVILFLVPRKFPDCLTVGLIPANATSWLLVLNRLMSPTSEWILAAVVIPIPGILIKTDDSAFIRLAISASNCSI